MHTRLVTLCFAFLLCVGAGFQTAAQPATLKKSISVGDVALGAGYSGTWDISEGVASMMLSALRKTDAFVVLERPSLSDLLLEQSLADQKLSVGQSTILASQQGRGQLLVAITVSEFGMPNQADLMNIGVIGGPTSSGRASNNFAKGRVAMDVRLVDARTTEVLHSFVVAQKIRSRDFGIDVQYELLEFGASTFNKTPLGEATRQVVDDAVEQIKKASTQFAWEGAVIEADGAAIYLNVGSDIGASVGDAFAVFKQTRDDNGLVQETILGTLMLEGVEPKMAWGTWQGAQDTLPVRGNRVVALQR
jgi:curli biogenesis system outer membrane secretion channel CsgG